ncbi:MAB_1171c family putative transporter [Kitasatospora sp. NPDC058184]|uniref:MAB_1171c family putative transporter n=1 Tax=Kitasatospora sp. NPDC058184 TaxID=3346370 RepID=UPI0036DB4A39
MTDPVLACAAVFLLGLSTYRFFAGRHRGTTPALRYTCCFAWCFGASLALMAGRTGADIDHGTGLAGLSWMLTDHLKMGSAGFLALAAVSLRRPAADARALRRRQAGVALAVLVATVLFLLARITEVDGQLVATGGAGPVALAGYDLVSVGYVVGCLVTLLRQTLSWTRQADTAALRTALVLITLTAAVGLLWTAWGVDDVLGALRSGRQQSTEDPVSLALGRLCAVLLLAGATTLLWARAGRAARRWRAAYRSYRSLGPLWRALHAVFPQIALAAGPLPFADAELALYRRVIEIRDGLLILRRYRTGETLPAGPEQPRGGGARATDAAARAEAARIAAALVRARARADTPADPAEAADPPQAEPSLPASAGIEAETRWLTQVAQALRTTPPLPVGRTAG